MRWALGVFGTALLLLTTQVEAVQLRAGWQKLMVPHSEEAKVLQLGGEILFRYSESSMYGAIVYVPTDVQSQLVVQNVGPGVLENRMFVPGGVIDATVGMPLTIPASELATYPAGTKGLYLVQWVGGTAPEMTLPVEAIGMHSVQGITYNAAIAVATPEQAAAVRALPYIQFVEPYHPYYRCGGRSTIYPTGRYYLWIEVATSDPAVIDFLRSWSDPAYFRADGSGIWVMTSGDGYNSIRRSPLVICVSVLGSFLPAVPSLNYLGVMALSLALALIGVRRL